VHGEDIQKAVKQFEGVLAPIFIEKPCAFFQRIMR
jgi:hypothetical protein